ncbi:heparinase II/III domain-containing protein [Halomontanus rarus]|uniref:heparinase II/III domain-containing protein n=1 Tax=Halomontanus rarus TaxID=3034020 RepID=UPI0023E87ADD|nr:heparinase II/III family protein [Halovivax sp. TS33]
MAQRNRRSSDEATRRTDEGRNWYGDELCAVRDLATDFDVSRRTMLAATGAGILGGLAASSEAVAAQDDDRYHRKTRPTIWTEEMRENARQNISEYDWAESQRDNAIEQADGFLERYGPDLESLWSLITSQKLPRGGGLSSERGILGGFSDPGTDRLWKIETTVDDPHGDGKLTVPTNDFAAYRESGLDDRGMFDPELADDQYLINEVHPEMGEGWGVDDGWGWIDENDDLGGGAGNRWNFVAYYNHWFIWRPGGVRRILDAVSEAYLLTGDSTYAVAGLTMLDRIADVYPEMSIWDYQQGDGFWNNHGGRQTGRILGGSWETNLVRNLMHAYDRLFPALDDDEVANDVLSFLDGKTEEFPGLEGKGSVAQIRENIEDNFLQEMLPAAKNSDLVPSRGQLSTVAISARVQDDTREGGYTREALEWVFQPGGERFVGDVWNEEPENWITTGGEILTPIVDQCDRDGYWHESAQLYNRIQMSSIRQVAEVLKGYDGFEGADLYQHPKMQQALGINSELILLDTLAPEIGDTHAYANGGSELWVSQSGVEDGYEVTGESYFAQLWHFNNGYSTAGISGSIFDAEPEGLGDEIQAIIDAEGPFDLPSQNLAGYGFAALRDGENHRIVDIGDDRNEFLEMDIVEQSTDVKRYTDRGYIQLEANDPNEYIVFEFDAPASDTYEVNFKRFLAVSYGIYEISINGEHVETHDFYDPESAFRDEWITIGEDVELEEGTNTIRFENVGRHEDSSNWKFAVGSLQLLDAEAQERRESVQDLGNAKRTIWMYYGRNGIGGGGTAHGHRDTLNLGVAANEMELARDLGYPEETGTHPPRQFFTDNTISHNTVTVDGKGQKHHWVGTPRHFDGSDERVNLIDVEAPHVYDETDEYRRTTAMISVDDEHSYGVDFFHVAGGDDHRFGFHATKANVTTDGLDLVAQDGGTLAGEDVPFGDDEYDDSMYAANGARTPGAGLNYFDNVERDRDPGETVVIDWDVEDHFGVRDDDAEDFHLRLTSFGDFDEVELADGYPPKSSSGAEPEPSIRYGFLNRSGSNLESDFVSTIEHYEGERAVDSVETVPVEGGDGNAVKVELATGRTDYVVCAFDEGDTLTVDDTFEFKGFFGVYSIEDGEPEYAYVHDGTRLKTLDGPALVTEPTGHVRGFVEDFTREMSLENEVSIRTAADRDQLERHAGFVYVDNDDSDPWRGEPDPTNPIEGRGRRGQGNGAYPIDAISVSSGNTITVDVGDKTFTRDFVDPDRLEGGGYNYIIAEEDDVRIPLTSTWSAN